MFRQVVFSLFSTVLLGQGPPAVPRVMLKSEAKCIIRVEGSTQLTVRNAAPGQVVMKQEFSLSIQGRLEEWEEPNGCIEFRFFPDKAAKAVEGRFKTQANEVKPMVEYQVLIEGSAILGMGDWFLSAEAFGKDLTAFPRDASALGRVSASTHPTLPLGEKQTVQLVIVPKVERDFPGSKQPHIQFQKGADLWALRNAQGPLSVTGVVSFEHTSPEQDAKGISRITFDLTPGIPLGKYSLVD